MNVAAIFDIGKTNKKAFLFDEDYQIIWEKSETFEEILDEDNFPCEDLNALKNWIFLCFEEIKSLEKYHLKGINFSAYGASFVHIDKNSFPLTPLYNYLKPYPEELKNQFYNKYKGEKKFALKTASPVLGNLNSGMQLFRLKKENKEIFDTIHCCLHLPQYLSFLFTKKCYTDITSIGCHTNLWNFKKKKYHKWVKKEKLISKIPPLVTHKSFFLFSNEIAVGIGLHDSSAALIPYFKKFSSPFVLLSTGTWNISMNPFNTKKLTFEEMQNDCLCYLQYKGKPVKSARLFAGNEHERETNRLSEYFQVEKNTYKNIDYNKNTILFLKEKNETKYKTNRISDISFQKRNLTDFENYEIAYHQLVLDIIEKQIQSIQLVIYNSPVKKIIVEGGFSKNTIFMNLLAEAFPELEVYAATVAQASALGAALAIHKNWNSKTIKTNYINLKRYKNFETNKSF